MWFFFWSLLVVAAAAKCPSCEHAENMCDCQGFLASSFSAETVCYEPKKKSSFKKQSAFAEGTCGYANENCDLKWASVCCSSSEVEEEGFFSRNLQTTIPIEMPDEF